jgi:hypothetical protein
VRRGDPGKTFALALLSIGVLLTVVAAAILTLRATSDVGEPEPVVYGFAVVGPLLAAAGVIVLRRRRPT